METILSLHKKDGIVIRCLTDVRLYNFGQQIQLPDLPIISVEYDGMTLGADWRKLADQRIKKYAKQGLQ